MTRIVTGRHRALNVMAIAAATRDEHPLELALPLSPRRLWRILRAEGIEVLRGEIRRPARVRGFDGIFVMTLRDGLAPRVAWKWALHEYAHVKLGHFPEGAEVERQLSPCRRDDPRELEAKLFARLLAIGPTATVETPAIARLIAALSGETTRKAAARPNLSKQLAFLDDDPDETLLREAARDAARCDAMNAPVPYGRVQFALSRAAWKSVNRARILLEANAPMPHYTNVTGGSDYELVTCDLKAAALIVELLARAGYKRTAVYVRRSIREAADPHEVRERHRAHLVRNGAMQPLTGTPDTWLTRRK